MTDTTTPTRTVTIPARAQHDGFAAADRALIDDRVATGEQA